MYWLPLYYLCKMLLYLSLNALYDPNVGGHLGAKLAEIVGMIEYR